MSRIAASLPRRFPDRAPLREEYVRVCRQHGSELSPVVRAGRVTDTMRCPVGHRVTEADGWDVVDGEHAVVSSYEPERAGGRFRLLDSFVLVPGGKLELIYHVGRGGDVRWQVRFRRKGKIRVVFTSEGRQEAESFMMREAAA